MKSSISDVPIEPVQLFHNKQKHSIKRERLTDCYYYILTKNMVKIHGACDMSSATENKPFNFCWHLMGPKFSW